MILLISDSNNKVKLQSAPLFFNFYNAKFKEQMISLKINLGSKPSDTKEESSKQISKDAVKEFTTGVIKLPATVRVMQWKSNQAYKTENPGLIQTKQSCVVRPCSEIPEVPPQNILAQSQNKSLGPTVGIKPQRKRQKTSDTDELLKDFSSPLEDLEEDYLRTWFEKLALQSTLDRMFNQARVKRIVTYSQVPLEKKES